jgi:hypothetical protein
LDVKVGKSGDPGGATKKGDHSKKVSSQRQAAASKIKAAVEPNRWFSHWDYVLKEMKWMATDFMQAGFSSSSAPLPSPFPLLFPLLLSSYFLPPFSSLIFPPSMGFCWALRYGHLFSTGAAMEGGGRSTDFIQGFRAGSSVGIGPWQS